MKFKSGMWLAALVAQCTATLALAANPELVDYSCPTSPRDQPAVFTEGTQALDFPGWLHIEDHSQSYRLTFTPRFDPMRGYFDTILIVGVPYTLDPATQSKTYLIDKKFRPQILDIPFNYCRSHRIPYSRKEEMTLGRLKIDDEAGHSQTARVKLTKAMKNCNEAGCEFEGLVAIYPEQSGDVANAYIGQGWLKQDVQILTPQP